MRKTQLTSLLATIVLATGLVTLPAQAEQPGFDELQQMELQKMNAFLGLMQQFFGIIESMHEVSDNPELAAIFQLHKIQEAYEEKGSKIQVARVMREVLENTDNNTIRAATFLMLGDLLKENGQPDEAIEILHQGLRESLRNAP